MQKLVVFLVVAAACTKPNPNRCCTDEADCNAKEIPVGSICEAGLVCRGNQCISEPCSDASDCEASAPYCIAELCAEACIEDAQCPGFGQAADQRYCVSGTCVQCRMGTNADCPSDAPVCDASQCRSCRAHSECPLGVCGADGACVDSSSIAFADPAGSATSDCTQALPCSLSRALALVPTKRYVLLQAGAYSSTTGFFVSGGERSLIGIGVATLTRSTQGPIVTIDAGASVTLENLTVSGATGTTSPLGTGIECPTTPAGAKTVTLRNVVVAQNASHGLHAQNCTVYATGTTFRNNAGKGLLLTDSNGAVDGCTVVGNEGGGIVFDAGLFTLANSFIYRNVGTGVEFYTQTTGNRFEFNTIVDNVGRGIECIGGTIAHAHPNNIIVRNMPNTYGAACTFPSSLVSDTDAPGIQFKSPDAAPYDYHLTAGSIAIDMATLSQLDHDFDGDPRTAPRDVGADEFVP